MNDTGDLNNSMSVPPSADQPHVPLALLTAYGAVRAQAMRTRDQYLRGIYKQPCQTSRSGAVFVWQARQRE